MKVWSMSGESHQAREFVEMAAVLVDQGLLAVHRMDRLSTSSAEAYWSASKCRIERWADTFQYFRAARAKSGASKAWLAMRPWFDEILITEILTRVWTAFATVCEAPSEDKHIEPIARSVFVGHLEARQRLLRLLVDERDLDSKSANSLDRVRRNAERWTDMLLGYLMINHDVSQFAFDPERVTDFAEGINLEREDKTDDLSWSLLQASLKASFGPDKTSVLPNTDLNQEILYGVFGAFGPDFYDAIGSFASLWRCRLNHIANDAEVMIEQLIREHDGFTG